MYNSDLNHHRHRHHLDGVFEVERMWGETAAAVARQHILMDMPRAKEVKDKEFFEGMESEWTGPNYFERKNKEDEGTV